MKRKILTAAAAAILALGTAMPARAQEAPKPKKALIEMAILLDTSGSMEGLINQARARLWAIVNTLASTKKDGEIPDLRVALYEYGKDSLPADGGYIRRIVELTDDLDKLSAELFALTTNGGDEYCGMVIQTATNQLTWTSGNHYKAIFIAGNEPFTQGPVEYSKACAEAIAKGIVVNTIHCGTSQEGIDGKWAHGASLADGESINIDQNAESVAIVAPQDARLEELSGKINDTYLGFGASGAEREKMQEANDAAASSAAPAAAAQRAMAKGGASYRNSSWDLVDALKDGTVDLKTLKEEDMPEEMRKMTPEEREAFVAKKSEERKAMQDEIQKLSAERQQYVAEEEKKQAEAGAQTFDSAVEGILGKQLEKKGYEVKKQN